MGQNISSVIEESIMPAKYHASRRKTPDLTSLGKGSQCLTVTLYERVSDGSCLNLRKENFIPEKIKNQA